MADAAQIAKWQKYRRQSLNALPGHAGFLAAVVLALLGLHWWLGLPLWVWLVTLAFGAWGLVGDCINIVYLARRVAAAEQSRP